MEEEAKADRAVDTALAVEERSEEEGVPAVLQRMVNSLRRARVITSQNLRSALTAGCLWRG